MSYVCIEGILVRDYQEGEAPAEPEAVIDAATSTSWLALLKLIQTTRHDRALIKMPHTPSQTSPVEFSRFLNRVSLDNGVLTVEGRRVTVLLLLGVFVGVCVFIVLADFPGILKVCTGIALPILVWAFLDVFFSRASMTFDIVRRQITLHRKSLKHQVDYSGDATGLLSLTTRRQPSTDSVPDFEVQLVFDDGSYRVPLVLETCAGEQQADERITSWQERLRLGGSSSDAPVLSKNECG